MHVKMSLFRIFNLVNWQKMLESLNMLHKLVQIHALLYYVWIQRSLLRFVMTLKIHLIHKWFWTGIYKLISNLIDNLFSQLIIIEKQYCKYSLSIVFYYYIENGLLKGKCCQYFLYIFLRDHNFRFKVWWSRA